MKVKVYDREGKLVELDETQVQQFRYTRKYIPTGEKQEVEQYFVDELACLSCLNRLNETEEFYKYY